MGRVQLCRAGYSRGKMKQTNMKFITAEITGDIQEGKTSLALALVNGFARNNNADVLFILPDNRSAEFFKKRHPHHEKVNIISQKDFEQIESRYQIMLIVMDQSERFPPGRLETIKKYYDDEKYKPSIVIFKSNGMFEGKTI